MHTGCYGDRLAGRSLVLGRALVLALVAACGSSTPDPAPLQSAPPADPPARTTPAPHIGWTGGAFEVTGLPAVARGGEVIALAYRDRDQERGFPNLRIELRDRHDATVWTVPVLTPNEYERVSPDGTATPELARRIAHGNAELERLHRQYDLVPMHALELLQPAQGDPHLAAGDGIDVDWDGDHLHVLLHNSERALTTRDGTPWLEPDHKACAGCDVCSNAAYLVAVYHAPEIPEILVELGYKGNGDACAGPSDSFHAVSW